MRVAIAGLGSAGRRHAANLVALSHDVTAFDPDKSRTAPGVRSVRSFQEAIIHAEALIVASPTSLHAEQAIAALQIGTHVLVEKPLAATVGGAEKIARLADRDRVVCAVAMNLRFHRGLREMKRLVDNRELGDVRLAHASFGHDLRLWRPDVDYRSSYSARAELGGGIVLDAIHELDYLLWILGPVDSIAAETGRLSDMELDVEDVAIALLRFRSGALGMVDLNFLEPSYRRGCLLVGSQATATWSWTDATITIRRAGSQDEELALPCPVEETYRAEVADFMDAIGSGTDPVVGAPAGVEAVRLAEALKQSAREGRRVAVGE